MKSGKSTYGSYGDVAAVDPVGEPLLKLMTLELKRGSSHGTPGDLLDFKPENKSHIFANALRQAIRSAKDARSMGWAMICRRDHRRAVIYIDARLVKELKVALRLHCMTYRLLLQNHPTSVQFAGILFDDFLQFVSPAQIITCVKNL